MQTVELTYRTGNTPTVVDITGDAAGFVAGKGDGVLTVFAPHATAGIALVEVGASSERDLLEHLDVLFPPDDRWHHRHGSPGHGADHVIPAFLSPSVSIPVLGGVMTLGTWQSVVLVDPNRDNPNRRVRLAFIAG